MSGGRSSLSVFRMRKKFREKPLAHANYLDIMFGNASATGEDAWTPSSGQLPPHVRGLDDVLLNDDEEIQGVDGFTPDVDTSVSDGSSKKRGGSATKLRPKKKTSAALQLNASLSRIVSAVKSTATSFMNDANEACTVAQCLHILNNMPEVVRGSPLYFIRTLAFQRATNREIFMALDADLRYGWLEAMKTEKNGLKF